MLVTREPVRRDIPHEEGEWVDICKLSWKELRDARKDGLKENAEKMKIFGVEWVKVLISNDDGAKKAQKIADAQEWDPTNFGTELLLEHGIVAWSYDSPVDATSIPMLDGATAAWLKQEIIDLNKPLSEEEEKNSSGSSSAV